MKKIGFDNDKYLSMQSSHIRERIDRFGGKLYLEFGGKLFDDYHASRVLPGFKPDSKLQMLLQLRDEAEIVIVINSFDIEKNKIRGDLGITYDADVLRLIDAFRGVGLYVGSVVLTCFHGQSAALSFQNKLEGLGIRVYKSDTNYLLFKSRPALYDRLLEKGILIRRCANFSGLDESFFRIAVRRHDENEELINTLREVL